MIREMKPRWDNTPYLLKREALKTFTTASYLKKKNYGTENIRWTVWNSNQNMYVD